MNINDIIYIYKVEEDKVLLKDYQKLLKSSVENKEEIIKIFTKKFKYDFFESSKLLVANNNLYPTLMILVNSIDVLAKHYSENIKGECIADNYKRFFNDIIFPIFQAEKISISEKFQEKLLNKFYYDLRCGITHSNSTKIEFTIDNRKRFIKQDKNFLININFLIKIIKEAFYKYIILVKKDDKVYNKFINVQKFLYGGEK